MSDELDRLKQFLRDRHETIRGNLGRTLQDARAAGEALVKAREECIRQQRPWLRWLEHEVGILQQTANNWIIIHRRWAELPTVCNLGVAEALKFLRGRSPATPRAALPPAPPIAFDRAGLPTPAALLPVFACRDQWDEARRLAGQIAALLGGLADGPGGEALPERFADGLAVSLARALDGAEPYAASCPDCYDELAGAPEAFCPSCHGRGWVTLPAWERTPTAHRDRLRAAVHSCQETAAG